jgi:hypothetical protein
VTTRSIVDVASSIVTFIVIIGLRGLLSTFPSLWTLTRRAFEPFLSRLAWCLVK